MTYRWPQLQGLFSNTFSAVAPTIPAANALPSTTRQLAASTEHRQDNSSATDRDTYCRFVHSPDLTIEYTSSLPDMMDARCNPPSHTHPADNENIVSKYNGLCSTSGTPGHSSSDTAFPQTRSSWNYMRKTHTN
ncbi:hypothetical protein BASA60_010707 [Batrachochytrium salamandrivorans]|nr:hypothetical protein BASA60_010707 [Batrachochytrium salamandrivorans]